MFLYVYKQIFHISRAFVTQKVKAVVMRNLRHTIFYVKTKISVDFQSCIGVPLTCEEKCVLNICNISLCVNRSLFVWTCFLIEAWKFSITLGVLIFVSMLFPEFRDFLAIFAKLNTREIFLDVKFANINIRETFLQLKFAKINTCDKS